MSKTSDIEANGQEIKNTVMTTKETKLWFKVEDPTEQHETGEVVTWKNKLTLTFQPQYLPNKRLVELTVVPRGEIRWNTTGANPKEGELYAGAIEIAGSDEVTLYAYAEDQGVGTQKVFKIRKADAPQIIEKDKPAKLKKALNGDGIKSSFEILKAAKVDNNAKLWEVSLTVGSGARSIRTRFGSEASVSAQAIEDAIEWARKTLGDNSADVQISIKGMDFSTGFDLEEFAKMLGEDIQAHEVEQG